MTFPFPAFNPVAPATVTYIGNTLDTVDRTTYTFAAHSLSTASADRKIVVAVYGQRVSVAVSTLTVNGVSASLVKAQPVSSADRTVELWQAAVPTDATGDIVVTFSGGNSAHCSIGVWAVYGAGSAAHATLGNASNPSTGTIDVPSGGVLIAASVNNNGSTNTWTGPTEKYDAALETSTGQSGASDAYAAAQTGMTVTATYSAGSTQQAMAAASWGPA